MKIRRIDPHGLVATARSVASAIVTACAAGAATLATSGCAEASSALTPVSPAQIAGANPPERVVATMHDDRVIYFDTPSVQGGRLKGTIAGCYPGVPRPGAPQPPVGVSRGGEGNASANREPLDEECVDRGSEGSVALASVASLEQTSYLPPSDGQTEDASGGSDINATFGTAALLVAVGAAVVAGVGLAVDSMSGGFGGWGHVSF